MVQKPHISVAVLDVAKRAKQKELDLTSYLFPNLEDRGEVYFALKAHEARHKPKVGYTRGRSEITGSQAKMYRQKGTGRARHSTSKAPQFVGGGICHGPKAKKGAHKVNRRVWRKAMQLLLLERLRQKKVLVFQELSMKAPKTKEATKLFPEVKDRKVIFVDQDNLNLAYSVRNLGSSSYKDFRFLSVWDMANQDSFVFSEKAFSQFMQRIQADLHRRGGS